MSLMLDHIDSPYIRCIGFLYLRYAVDPNIVWSWMEPYLYDEEPVQIAANPAKPEITVGEYVRQLLTEMDYYGTLLPRLPVQIERDIKVSLLQAEQIEDRAKSNLRDASKMDHFRRVGSSARALYGDEENPVTWYDCVVDRVLTHDDATGEPLARPKFVVTFPEYGNTETVSVGEIDLRLPPGGAGGGGSGGRGRYDGDNDGRGGEGSGHHRGRGRECYDGRGQGRGRDYDDRHRGRGRSSGGYGHDREYGGRREDDRWRRDRFDRDEMSRNNERSRSRSRDRHGGGERDLLEEVRRRDREAAAAKGRDYARRPPSVKKGLEGVGGSSSGKTHDYRTDPDSGPRRSVPHERPRGDPTHAAASSGTNEQPRPEKREKTPEEIAAVQEKKRKLMSKYG